MTTRRTYPTPPTRAEIEDFDGLRRAARAAGEPGPLLPADWDLAGADLSGVDLSGIDLTGVYFRKADLRKADLSGAVLIDADMGWADLRGADLSGADPSARSPRRISVGYHGAISVTGRSPV